MKCKAIKVFLRVCKTECGRKGNGKTISASTLQWKGVTCPDCLARRK